jgi:hypothetical protein
MTITGAIGVSTACSWNPADMASGVRSWPLLLDMRVAI